LSATVTENSLPSGTLTEQGVRQVPPIEIRASAPGGLDSIDNGAVVGLDEKKSMLGIANEQAARHRPPAMTAMARLVRLVRCCSRVPFNRSNSSSWTHRPRPDIPRPAAKRPTVHDKALAQCANFRIRKISS
jgi:hypothetical protein